jgi:hypothetical protein
MTSLQANDYNQTVSAKVASYTLVASDAGTRITMANVAATTITVNTNLFTAGDTLTITNISSGVCTITAGTATVGTSSTLALKQYDSGQLYFTSTGVAIFFSTDAADSTSPLTTKGDLYGYSTLDARIPIGTNNQVLTADSAQALGLKWATPATSTLPILTYVEPAANFTTTSTSYVDVTGYTITFTPTSATNKILVMASAYTTSANTKEFKIALDGTNICSRDVAVGELGLSMNAYITNLSASSHTIKLQMLSVGGGSATVAGATSGYISNFSVMELY